MRAGEKIVREVFLSEFMCRRHDVEPPFGVLELAKDPDDAHADLRTLRFVAEKPPIQAIVVSDEGHMRAPLFPPSDALDDRHRRPDISLRHGCLTGPRVEEQRPQAVLDVGAGRT